MAGWIRESRGGRSILLVLFALVLAIRVAIPTGFMPTAAPKGIVISVCTGLGETKAFLPTGDDDAPEHVALLSDAHRCARADFVLQTQAQDHLIEAGLATEEHFKQLDKDIKKEVAAIGKAAEAQPEPDASELWTDITH